MAERQEKDSKLSKAQAELNQADVERSLLHQQVSEVTKVKDKAAIETVKLTA